MIIAVLIKTSNSKITKNKTILPYIVGMYLQTRNSWYITSHTNNHNASSKTARELGV